MVERLDVSFILNKFSDNIQQAKKPYEEFFVGNTNIQSPVKNAFRGIALRKDSFIKKIKERIKMLGKDRETKETSYISACNPDQIVKAIVDNFDVKKDSIFKKQRGNIYRELALYLIKRYTVLSLRGVGRMFDIDYTSESVSVKRFEERMRRDKNIKGIVARAIEGIEKDEE